MDPVRAPFLEFAAELFQQPPGPPHSKQITICLEDEGSEGPLNNEDLTHFLLDLTLFGVDILFGKTFSFEPPQIDKINQYMASIGWQVSVASLERSTPGQLSFKLQFHPLPLV